MPFRYPVALELTGRRCLVVGGGSAAELRTRGLLDADARVVVVATEFTSGLSDLAARGEVELLARPYQPGDVEGAFLVFVTGDDAAVRAAVFAEADERGVLCNAVDDVRPLPLRHSLHGAAGRAPAHHLHRRPGPRLGQAAPPPPRPRRSAGSTSVLLDVLGEVRDETLPDRTGRLRHLGAGLGIRSSTTKPSCSPCWRTAGRTRSGTGSGQLSALPFSGAELG